MLYPMKLKAPLKDYIWGGTRLKTEFHKETKLSRVAESWELSCHPDGESIVENGRFAGKTLQQVLKQCGMGILGNRAAGMKDFPILVKLIDAYQDLSVQVHPGEEYAEQVEKQHGKTEAWYILDAEPGAELIWGVKNRVSKAEFAARIRESTVIDICNKVPVKKGDVFFIEPGTLHAIGKGILLLEIQQNSNTTYRVYDYKRKGKDGRERKLHVDKALDVLNLEPVQVKPISGRGKLVDCPLFQLESFVIEGESEYFSSPESFAAATLITGEICLEGEGMVLALKKGDTVFFPAGEERFKMRGKGEFLLSTI